MQYNYPWLGWFVKRWPRAAQVGRKGLAAVFGLWAARGGTPAARDGGGWRLVGLDTRKPLPMRPKKHINEQNYPY